MTYTIAVLAGGKSTRFGVNKLFFQIGTKTMLEWVLYAALNSKANEIILSVKSLEFDISDKIKGKIKVVEDEIGEYSPLVGIMSAARASTNSKIVIVSADSPLVTGNFLNLLDSYLEKMDVDGVVPIWSDGRIEAIHAAYRTSSVLSACELLTNYKNYNVKAIPGMLKRVYFLPVSYLEKRDKLSITDFDSPSEILDGSKLS
jgi:molybdopterin-guanine dinucleotide biosynthesis protein A